MRADMHKVIVERPCKRLWFAATYRQCAEESLECAVYDVVRRRLAPAHERHAVCKRQLSARELADHALQNENQKTDGKVPQRHKRKRKRTRP